MSNNDMPVLPGWETVRLIGRGSFGAVYEIERDMFGHKEKAALKHIRIPQSESDLDELLNDGFDEESITARFRGYLEDVVREYSLMADMKGCANIVYCDDVKCIQHQDGIGWDVFIRMELLTPLPKYLRKTVPDEQVVRIGCDILSALVFCEKRNLLHRDIKPKNIFVAPDGTYKLGDFGIAKTVEKTSGGTKTGTFKYMAPEVYNNRPYGAKSDIYSLGLVLYWLLNKRRAPFLPLPPNAPTAADEEQARARRMNGEPIPPPLNGSEELKRIVLKACAYEPQDRYQSAEEMLRDLEPLLSSPRRRRISAGTVEPAAPVEDEDETGTTIASEAVMAGNAPSEEASVSAGVEEETFGTSRKAPAPVRNDQAADVPPVPAGGTGGQSRKKSSRRALPIILGTLAVLALAAAALFFFRPRYGTWSEWSVEEPAQIAGRKVETSTEYRSRELVLLSTENKEDVVGEIDHEETKYGAWGKWSDWQTDEIQTAEGIEVEEGTQYRFRKKEYTTSDKSTLSGWTQNDLQTETFWGEWGEWSDVAVTATDTRQVETATQYRYRTREYATFYEPYVDGWRQYDSATSTDWGDWSDWSANAVSPSDTRQVDSRHMYRVGTNYVDKETNEMMWPTSYSAWSDEPQAYDDSYHDAGDYFWWSWPEECEVYRYRDLYTTSVYYFYRWGDWSDWSNSAVTKTNDREVETRTIYRYKDQESKTSYSFWRWGSWSSWTSVKAVSTDEKEVETRTVYRSREGEKIPVYFYHDWSDWSDWTQDEAKESESCEVETRTIYRYADRQ